MRHVFIAGATGYLGRYLCTEYARRGWHVTALARNTARARGLTAHRLTEAEATRPESLTGLMAGAELVISALGITRQADGVGYWDVDYQANLNLLREAQREGVARFSYVSVFRADHMPKVRMVAAKRAFVRKMRNAPMQTTVIAPTAYFSDMEAFLHMARSGRVWLFGDGSRRLNPIHGADLAQASAEAIDAGKPWLDIGGPETMSQSELARLCFTALGRPARITSLPDLLRKASIRSLPYVTPRRIAGPAEFFLTAMGMDMVAPPSGTHRLSEHLRRLAETEITTGST